MNSQLVHYNHHNIVRPGVFEIPRPPERIESSTRYINFRRDPRDWSVPFLAMFGFNYKAIAAATGLSVGQIAYRLTKLNLGRTNGNRITPKTYRNGTSPVAQMVVAAVGNKVKAMIAPQVALEQTTKHITVNL